MRKKIDIYFSLLLLFSFCLNVEVYGQGDQSRTRRKKNRTFTNDFREKPTVKANNTSDATLVGVILDKTTGEFLPGVTVQLMQNNALVKGTITDLNGKFSFDKIPPASYQLKVTYVSYQTKEIQSLTVEAGKLYELPLTMEEVGVNIQEVVIQSDVRKESEAAALVMQKMNLRMMDIFSGDMVLKTSSDLFVNTTLARMPGIIFLEDKYLGIRGMPERYNSIMLNGALMPITQSDRQSFDFTNLPSNMISQIQLVKSCMADIPSNFAGGAIFFETLDIPEKNLTQINYQTIYNSLTTFKPMTLGVNDNHKGILGFMGSPKPYLPKDFPETAYIQTLDLQSQELAQIGRKVNYNFHTQTKPATPGQSISLTFQRRFQTEQNIWGFNSITNISHQNTTQWIDQNVLSEYDENLGYNPVGDSSFYSFYQQQQNINQIFNLGYQNARLKVSLKQFFTYTQWRKYIHQEGNFYFENAWEPYHFYVKRYERQTLYTSQANIAYSLKQNHKIHLNPFVNLVSFYEPGFYPIQFSQNTNGSWYISDSWIPEDRVFYTIFSANQKDNNKGINLFHEAEWYKNKDFTLKSKTGVFVNSMYRNFISRKTGIVPTLADSTTTPSVDVTTLLEENPDNFTYNPNHIQPNGFFFFDDTQIHDSYRGNALNLAAFHSFEINYRKWIFYTGLRFDNMNYLITSFTPNQEETVYKSNILDVLPSFIASYQLKENHKLKLAYCQSVMRPDMREFSRFTFFNLYNSITWIGNPELKRTKIHSLDLKYEWFMENLGLLSVSLFYKYLHLPVEQMLAQGATAYLNTYTLANSQQAQNYGLELEFRKKLGQENYFKNFTFYGNFMLQNSHVKNERTGLTNRPLQGQSPYLINLGVLFKEPKTNLSFDVFYNRFGRQIAIIGLPSAFNNLYILPRHRVDFQITKTIKEKLFLKLAFQDILAQPFYKVQFKTNEKTAQLQDATLVTRTQVGRIISFAVQYRF